MGLIAVPQARSVQPHDDAQLDPAWQALAVLAPWRGIDLVSGKPPTANSALYPRPCVLGQAIKTPAATNEMHWGEPSAAAGIHIAGPRIFLWAGVLASVGNSAPALFTRWYSGGTYQKGKWWVGTTGDSRFPRARFGLADGTILTLDGTTVLQYQAPLVIAARYTGTVAQLWVNGRLEAEAAGGGYTGIAYTTGRLSLGRDSYSYSAANANHVLGAVLGADPGEEAVRELSENPWLLWAPETVWVPTQAAGGANSEVLASGSATPVSGTFTSAQTHLAMLAGTTAAPVSAGLAASGGNTEQLASGSITPISGTLTAAQTHQEALASASATPASTGLSAIGAGGEFLASGSITPVSGTLTAGQIHQEALASGSITPVSTGLAASSAQVQQEALASGSITPVSTGLAASSAQVQQEALASGSITPVSGALSTAQTHQEALVSGSITPASGTLTSTQTHQEALAAASAVPASTGLASTQTHYAMLASGQIVPVSGTVAAAEILVILVSEIVARVRAAVSDRRAGRFSDTDVIGVVNDAMFRLYAIRPDLRFGGYDAALAPLVANDTFPLRASYARKVANYTVAVLEAEQDDSARVDRAQLFMAQFDREAFY